MKEILIFAGTTEGRKLSEYLAASGIKHTICVATEYGEIVLTENEFVSVHRGRMNQDEIKNFIQNGNYAAVVDATHPYAEVVTENIKQAMKDMECSYIRLKRQTDFESDYEKILCFDTNEECAKALENVEGNILLTTGSKELDKYCVSEDVKDRLFVRILPGMESFTRCVECGINGKKIIALQGPFTTELNAAIIRQYEINCMVTKASGKTGGYQEKIEAAKATEIPLYVIGHPKKDEGYSFEEVCNQLEEIFGERVKKNNRMEIVMAGVGMGSKMSLTKEVQHAIENADILLGAERMIADYKPRIEKKSIYRAEDIIPYLKVQDNKFNMQTGKVVILFSGDSGFYSGCQSLYKALQNEIKMGRLNARLNIMPGISSIAYLAACIGESYHDGLICSMHGKELVNLERKIRAESKIFMLMSGAKDLNKLGNILVDADMEECEIVAGYQLSYPNEKIMKLTPKECMRIKEEGLYTCFIKNLNAKSKEATHGKLDAEFIRGEVPMTKEEVREVSICKLKLNNNSIVYDIGSGTGSIAVEVAGLSDDIKVVAIEQNEDAVLLIQKNVEKFKLENISVVKSKAPNGFDELPVPTHAFLGGSGGRMKEILSSLYKLNPKMRVVINAITMETICEIREVLSKFCIENEEILQMQVSRAHLAGKYHLMKAENPVWICSFDFVPEMRTE